MKTSAIQGELDSVQKNLQHFIDEDTLHINSNLIRMIINSTKLHFYNNDPIFPILSFKVLSSPFRMSNTSINEVHLYAKPEVIPHSAISCWNTNGYIFKVESNSYHKINENNQNVTFFLTEGEIIGGHERIYIQYL
jgi:hypothetical protein